LELSLRSAWIAPLQAQEIRVVYPTEAIAKEDLDDAADLYDEISAIGCVDKTAYDLLKRRVDGEIDDLHHSEDALRKIVADSGIERPKPSVTRLQRPYGLYDLIDDLVDEQKDLRQALSKLKICDPETIYRTVPLSTPPTYVPPGLQLPPGPPPVMTLDTECKPCQKLTKEIAEIDKKIATLERSQESLRQGDIHSAGVQRALRQDDAKLDALKKRKAELEAQRRECEQQCQPKQTGWRGPFGGGQLAVNVSRVQTREFITGTAVETNSFNDRGSAIGGGVNAGYNWQPFGNTTVVGLVFDVEAMNNQVRHTFAGGTYIGSTVNVTGSAQLRAGVLATPSTLLYAQSGLSVANQRLQINFGGPQTNVSQVVPGYAAGVGAEWMLARNPLPFGRSMSVFVDYRHTWWDKAMLRMPAASPRFDYDWTRQTDRIAVGVRSQFGN